MGEDLRVLPLKPSLGLVIDSAWPGWVTDGITVEFGHHLPKHVGAYRVKHEGALKP